MQTHFDFRGPEKLPLLAQALFLVHGADGFFFLQSHLPSVYIFFCLAALGLCCYMQASPVAHEKAWGVLPSCNLWASLCGDSRCGAQALGFAGFSSCDFRAIAG